MEIAGIGGEDRLGSPTLGPRGDQGLVAGGAGGQPGLPVGVGGVGVLLEPDLDTLGGLVVAIGDGHLEGVVDRGDVGGVDLVGRLAPLGLQGGVDLDRAKPGGRRAELEGVRGAVPGRCLDGGGLCWLAVDAEGQGP